MISELLIFRVQLSHLTHYRYALASEQQSQPNFMHLYVIRQLLHII